MKVAVLMLSYNRFDVMPEVLVHNVSNAGHPFDLYIWDNGSNDERVIRLLASSATVSLEPFTHVHFNTENIGIAAAFNRMLASVSDIYDAFVFMANDIKEPNNWLADRVRYLKAFPNSGMISQSPHQVRPDYPEYHLSACEMIYVGDVIGQFMISKNVLDRVGAFREDFGEYGPIDNDYNHRCYKAGFTNYYIPGMAVHMDEQQPIYYGYDKQQRIAKTWAVHVEGLGRYNDPKNIYIPLPGEHTINMKDNV